MKRQISILICFSLVFLAGFATLSFAATEQVTITTYYPAPYGIYHELRADQMAVGSPYRASPIGDGDLIVSGYVAIGIPLPVPQPLQYPLEVRGPTSGAVKIVDGNQQPNYVLTTVQGDGVATWAPATGAAGITVYLCPYSMTYPFPEFCPTTWPSGCPPCNGGLSTASTCCDQHNSTTCSDFYYYTCTPVGRLVPPP